MRRASLKLFAVTALILAASTACSTTIRPRAKRPERFDKKAYPLEAFGCEPSESDCQVVKVKTRELLLREEGRDNYEEKIRLAPVWED